MLKAFLHGNVNACLTLVNEMTRMCNRMGEKELERDFHHVAGRLGAMLVKLNKELDDASKENKKKSE